MRKVLLSLVVLGLLRLGVPAVASANTGDFLGVWVNVDGQTNRITRIAISGATGGDELKIRTFGKCVPTDCDWGTETLHLYGSSITDSDYQHATAIYEQRGITTLLTLEFEDDGRLALHSYTRFTKDDRNNYHAHDHFRKSERQPQRCPDLIVETIERPQWDGTNHRSIIKAVITNVGTARADATLARLVDPSTPQNTGAPYNDVQSVPALDPGMSYTVTFTLPYWVYNPDAELGVEADYKGTLQECDETNNTETFFQIG